MSYTPNNVSVYIAAYKAIAGFYDAQFSAPSDYSLLANAWAEALDTAWGSGAFTGLELDLIGSCSVIQWQGQAPPADGSRYLPSAYTAAAEEVVVLVQTGNAEVVAQGINPNGGGVPGTTGGIISVATTAALASQPPTPLVDGSLAFVQANGGSYWAWYPTGYSVPAGTVTTTAGNGGVWAFVKRATASTPATVLGGATYTAIATDVFIAMDSSNGTQPVVNLYATPYVGQEVTIRWVNGTLVLPEIVGNGNTVTDYATGASVASTVINTPAGFITYKFVDGTRGWQQVG
jgi:hypothetical protein